MAEWYWGFFLLSLFCCSSRQPLRVRVFGGTSRLPVTERPVNKRGAASQPGFPAQPGAARYSVGRTRIWRYNWKCGFCSLQKQGLTGSAPAPARSGRQKGASASVCLCAAVSAGRSQPPHSNGAAKDAQPSRTSAGQECRVQQRLRTALAQVESSLLLATWAFTTLVTSVGKVVPIQG